jgi:periplasmic protein TonB
MFEQTFLVGTGRTRRAWTVPVSFAGQIAVAGLMVLLPLIFTDKLRPIGSGPTPPIRLGAWRPAPGTVMQLVPAAGQGHTGAITTPTRIPDGIAAGGQEPLSATAMIPGPPCVGDCGPEGDPRGIPWGVLPPDSRIRVTQAPPVERPREQVQVAEPTKPARITVGGLVQQAKLIVRVTPLYPRLAAANRIAGAVHLAAVIGADGRVRELRVLSGHPLLVPAAVDAVRQWQYQPTKLNSDPVEVATDIVVNFILSAR